MVASSLMHCSMSSVTNYPLQEQCRLHAGIRSFNEKRRGSFAKFYHQRNNVVLRCHSNKSFLRLARNDPKIITKTLPEHQRLFARLLHAISADKDSSNLDVDCKPKYSLSSQLHAFWRFCRPHTIIGTCLGITTISLLSVESWNDLSITFWLEILKAILPAVLMNIYVVGVNQLFDVEIDKINKPDLPLASGEFSMTTGWIIVAAASTMSFGMGFIYDSPALLCALLICFLIGSVYSLDLPFLRWKRYPFLAASSILTVRALVLNVAFFIHMQNHVLGKPVSFPRSFIFGTTAICLFSTVIALFKDIPDVEGDRDFGIQSFSVRLGQEKIFWLCINILLTVYGIGTAVGATSHIMPSTLVSVLGHGTLALALWLRARSTDLSDKDSLTAFYMFIWKLFYLEYLLIPFVR